MIEIEGRSIFERSCRSWVANDFARLLVFTLNLAKCLIIL